MAANRRVATTGPLSGTNFAVDVNDEVSRLYNGVGMFLENVSGVNNITCTVTPTLDAYAKGQLFYLTPTGLNSGAVPVQINIDGRGFKAAVDTDGSDFAAGALNPDHVVPFVYDGTRFKRLAIAGVEGPAGGSAELAQIVNDILALDGQTWQNGVRDRFPGVEKTNDLPNLGQRNADHSEVLLPTVITFKNSDSALYGLTGARSYLHLSYSQALLNNQPIAVWFVPRSHIEAAAGTITGSSSGGAAPPANCTRLSMKIGIINSMMTQHDLANMTIDFLITYGPAGDNTSADPSYIADESIRFAKDATTNMGGWGEPSGQPGAPDATFWANGHTAGVHDDGDVTTYWHEGVPVPVIWGNYVFKGVKLVVRGSLVSSPTPSLPLTLGLINFAVIPSTVDLRGPLGTDYYLQFLNYEDLVQPGSDQTDQSTILATIGDSHTEDIWPSLVSERIGGEYFNFAVGGESSGQMIPRFATLLASSPNMVGLYASPNDPGGDTTVVGSPAPTDTVFTVADAAKLGIGSWVIVNGETRQIEDIDVNEITLTEALSIAPSDTDDVEIATQRNNEHMIDLCWEAQVYRIFIVGSHYKNYSVNGDTIDVEQTVAETLRNKQRAAAESRGVLYVDTYRYFSSLIRVGAQVQGDFAGHDADEDPHLNDTGQDIQIARPVEQAIRQAGWV